MSYIIAITGKGGTGKTTISALIIRSLIARGRTPVLAVDADPNSCLDIALGIRAEKSVGRIREEAKIQAGKGAITGMGKQAFLEMKIAECLVEAKDFDYIAMGRCEGPGCYCYANNVLRDVLGKLSDEYPYIVLDNEAGLENLSRRIVKKVNLMVMVSDASNQGLTTLSRLHGLTSEMGISYEHLAIIVNRMRGDSVPSPAQNLQSAICADYFAGISENDDISKINEQGQSLLSVSNDNPAYTIIDNILEKAGLLRKSS